MPLAIAQTLALLVYAYAALGLAFGLYFVARGAEQLDTGFRGAGLGLRLLVLPGSALLWPLLLYRLAKGAPERQEHNAHRDLAARGKA